MNPNRRISQGRLPHEVLRLLPLHSDIIRCIFADHFAHSRDGPILFIFFLITTLWRALANFAGEPPFTHLAASRSVFRVRRIRIRMARADAGDQDSPRREIRLVKDDDGRWSAIDEVVGVASQGETRSEALAAVDEAVALHSGEIGDPITDADLREHGIDPDTIPDEPQEPDAPWFSASQ